ncbi:restriction endonuclease [Nocardia sp. NBC_00511]|uniref:restriction endonuclease n=1 Tax=Nocardia sp. NBC_00511 TaxID=2903591 RepID=UPI0030E47E34
MARRGGLASAIIRASREADRAAAASQRQAQRIAVAQQRAMQAADRERVKTDKARYEVSRRAEAEAMTAEVDASIAELTGLLASSIGTSFRLDSLRVPIPNPPFHPGSIARFTPQPDPQAFAVPPKKLLQSRSAYDAMVRDAQARYSQAVAEHHRLEAQRQAGIASAQATHQQYVHQLQADAQHRNAQVDDLGRRANAGEAEAISDIIELALNSSAFPESFPNAVRAAYVAESKQAVVEYVLPTVEVIPTVRQFKWVKAGDKITESARPATQIKLLYASVVAQSALRVVREVFACDSLHQVQTVVFNGIVETVDPATGKPVRPCLLTLRTTRDTFEGVDLAHVDPSSCLKHLGAGVSKSPAELAPVRPVVEFDMVDPRYIPETDIVGGLDQRTNLLELTPNEFEGLIQNLFSAMGLEAKQTQASRDGGVDCVAYDNRPIFGGKVVIQAKRYKNTVGVSAVRDLFGTLQNEGASKGILVTTSGYGKASYQFAQNKPLELLDGPNLLYLLQEHLGLEAKIVAPDDWKDPIADSAP